MSIKPRDDNKENREHKPFHDQEKGRYLSERERKANEIVSEFQSIRKIDQNTYLVQSQSGKKWYRVQFCNEQWICDCQDFYKNGHVMPCKHIIALENRYESFENPYVLETEKEFEKKKYSQNWPLYNLAQMHEFELFDQFLFQLLESVEEPDIPPKRGRPDLKLRDRLFCCMLKVYSKRPTRKAWYLYQDAFERGRITHAPNFNVVSTTLCNKEITPILYDLVLQSARPLASIEHDFAVDSSGFRCSTFGNYCEEKHGIRQKRNWLKCHLITGVQTNIIGSVVITNEYSADSPQLKELIIKLSKYFNLGEISGDKAYSSRENFEIIDKCGGIPLIPFKKNATGKSKGTALWRKSYLYFQMHYEEFMERYHKRSNVETSFFAIKRKLDETIQSKNPVAQENELLCKIISYNITVLIRELVQLNGSIDFLKLNGLKLEGEL